jgi:HD superfamily phosphohydrolase
VPGRFTLFSDPVHGFVSVPKGLVLELVASAPFQRLRRIRQLGLGFLVFPGAVHTRFEHALGAMALMQDALLTLQEKGAVMTTDEVEGALAAALLHDVGHGPFSHTLEEALLPPGPPSGAGGGRPFHHERMSRALMERLNEARGGALDVALAMFDGLYDRPFFHALVASQLDMDRLDYLRRDSFYTGVAEGVVGVQRILKTLRVHPAPGGPGARIVVEAKGAYAVENFLLSRRLMYGQVYHHKTVLAADHLLLATFARARARRASGAPDPALDATAPSLAFFLDGSVTAADLDRPPGDPAREALLDHFVALDDTDVLYSVKRWAEARDPVLADLARRFLLRQLPRTTPREHPATEEELAGWRAAVARRLVAEGISTPATAEADAACYVGAGVARIDAYSVKGDAICLLGADGSLRELSEASDLLALGAAPVEKPYVVLPKEIMSAE